MTAIPSAARVCIAAAVLCAAAAAVPVVAVLSPAPGAADAAVPWTTVLLLTVLYAGCELPALPLLPAVRDAAPARRPGDPVPAGAGTFFPVLLAAAFLLPPAAAVLVPVPGALLGRVDRPPAGARRAWRAARSALGTWAAAHTYLLLGGERTPGAPDFPYALVPALGGALAFWVLLTVLDGGIRVMADGMPAARGALWRRVPLRTVRRGFSASPVPYCVHGLVGLMMAVLWVSPYGPPAALFVLLPMYISCWIFAQYHRERAAHQATIRALVQAVDIKDRYTRGHSERVGRASALIARELGMEEERLEVVRFAGILHDVGKLGVPTRVLRKEGPLTPQERRVIELHPEYGHEMVRGIGFLGQARAAILHHHERMDGSGYPYGLVGHQIPEYARVVAVADAFDAMTSTRSYRRARPVPVALAELRRCAGTQFDPRMVRALVRALERHGWQTSVTSDETAVALGPQRMPEGPGTGASHQIRTG
ncbi:HD-GYP domain-containing protein [Streptomyces peucetius]|uniref:HD-GYP domain-containing protein n=1 Tax=Streptomyces peucetius TaxID=1950 RepID=A0ABY6IBB7_STRPE|nr:HD-GYP domain-containing protein [Streptomyces peucetius]UYQ64302.1 HD-GYP domain-containing protein [Streptomyces peucetius]